MVIIRMPSTMMPTMMTTTTKNTKRTPSSPATIIITTVHSSLPILLLLALLALAVCPTEGSVPRCPEGQFRRGGRCELCSACPVNQIIRRPCTELSDTLCGPFIEFLEFHQAPKPHTADGVRLPLFFPDDLDASSMDGVPHEEGLVEPYLPNEGTRAPLFPGVDDDGANDDDDDDDSDDGDGRRRGKSAVVVQNGRPGFPGRSQAQGNPSRKTLHTMWRQQLQDRNSGAFQDLKESGGVPPEGGSELDGPRVRGSGEGDAENQWKVLALALIVVLCIVCIFLIVFVFVVCYMRARSLHPKHLCSSSADHTSAAGNRPSYFVPVLTTHAHQSQTGCSGRDAPPGGSYLYGEDYDADNSGQTVSTVKSSDYVYFKSPTNGNSVVYV